MSWKTRIAYRLRVPQGEEESLPSSTSVLPSTFDCGRFQSQACYSQSAPVDFIGAVILMLTAREGMAGWDSEVSGPVQASLVHPWSQTNSFDA